MLEFYPDGKALFAASRWWAFRLPLNRQGGVQVSRSLGAPWSQNHGISSTGATVRALLAASSEWWRLEELRGDGFDVAPLAGDPTALKKLWQQKLKLQLDGGELAPIDQVRIPRPADQRRSSSGQ
jgi:hypothetical protein